MGKAQAGALAGVEGAGGTTGTRTRQPHGWHTQEHQSMTMGTIRGADGGTGGHQKGSATRIAEAERGGRRVVPTSQTIVHAQPQDRHAGG